MAKKKSETRVAFEKKFAAERKKHGGDGGVFTFRGKKYTTDYAKTKKKEVKKKDSDHDHNFDYSPDSEHMKKHHTFKKAKSKSKSKKKFDYSKKFSYSKKKLPPGITIKESKKKLGGFKDDSFLEGPTPILFED